MVNKAGERVLGKDGKPRYRPPSAADLSLVARRLRDLGVVSARRKRELERMAEDEIARRIESGGFSKARVLPFRRSNTDGAA